MTPTIATSPDAWMRTLFTGAAREAQKAADAPALDPKVRVQLTQAQRFLDNASRALERQQQAATRFLTQLSSSHQFGAAAAAQLGFAVPLSTAGLQASELVCTPEVLDELKKHREREKQLAGELHAAMDGTQRPNLELLRVLGFLDFSPTREQNDGEVNGPGIQPHEPRINPHDKDASGLVWDSHADFYEMIGVLIGALQQNWLSKYQDAMAKYLEFYEEFSDILEKLKPEAAGDKGDIKIDFKEVQEELAALLANLGYVDKSELAKFTSEAAAQAFKDSLGLPGLKVMPRGDGTFSVTMDASNLRDLVESMPETGKPMEVTWDSAKYNAWVSAKDSNVEQIKHVSKVLGEKLSEMTQKFDNIVKILSSTIDKITDADMSFINGL